MIWSAPNGRLAWLVSSRGRAATAATCRDDLVAAKRPAATQDEGCLGLLKPSSLWHFWAPCSPKRADPGARQGRRWDSPPQRRGRACTPSQGSFDVATQWLRGPF